MGAVIVIVVLAGITALIPKQQPVVEAAAPIETPDPDDVFDPTNEEGLPSGYLRLLRRDAIRPVYQPEFTQASNAGWPAESLVIGIVGDTAAKAYPVSYLNRREMIIDHLDGRPILVTW